VLFGFGQCVGESATSQVICLFFTLLTVAVFARAIVSWFGMDPRSPIIQVLDQITEPILDPIRRIMPRLGMIDFSPLIAILLLQFVSRGLQSFFG
jgi:YggT family protein